MRREGSDGLSRAAAAAAATKNSSSSMGLPLQQNKHLAHHHHPLVGTTAAAAGAGGARQHMISFGKVYLFFLLLALSFLYLQFTALNRYSERLTLPRVFLAKHSNAAPHDAPTHHAANNNNNSTTAWWNQYYHPAVSFEPPAPAAESDNLFTPERILQRYIAWHGQESLQRERHDPAQAGRKFSIAYYSCPQRLGSTIHAFFNDVIWAILTNRTVLWKYDEEGARNTVQDCDQFLESAAWLPSFDEWSQNVSSSFAPEPVVVSPVKMNTVWNLRQAQRMGMRPRFYSAAEQRASLVEPQVVVFPRFRDMLPLDEFDISRILWNDDPQHLVDSRNNAWDYYWYRRWPHIEDAWTRQTMEELYSEGLHFLYGLLFRTLFRNKAADEELMVGLPEDGNNNNNNNDEQQQQPQALFSTSIALHSRHDQKTDDGTDVAHELECLQRLLRKSKQGECVVYIMSDRQVTLDLIGAYVRKRGCRNETVPAHVKGAMGQGGDATFGYKVEHGAFGRSVRVCVPVIDLLILCA